MATIITIPFQSRNRVSYPFKLVLMRRLDL